VPHQAGPHHTGMIYNSLRLASMRLPGGRIITNNSLVSYSPRTNLTTSTSIVTLLPKQYYRMSSPRGVLLWVFSKGLSDDQSWFREKNYTRRSNCSQELRLLFSLPMFLQTSPFFQSIYSKCQAFRSQQTTFRGLPCLFPNSPVAPPTVP